MPKLSQGVESFERNCVACGRFIGKTSCLAYATGAGFVSIMDGTNGGHQGLNLDVHLSVRHLLTCKPKYERGGLRETVLWPKVHLVKRGEMSL